MLPNKGCFHPKAGLVLLLLFLIASSPLFAGPADFNIDGVYEAALDLPRILFLLKKDADGPALEYRGSFELNWAFLDTGASGILLSRETVDYLQISVEPIAQYADVGVGGIEFFDVSEPLYIGTTAYDDPNPYDQDHYLMLGPWRFQVNQNYASGLFAEPLDLLGTPVILGKIVVLNSRGPSKLEYFTADIREPNDSSVPKVDFNVPLRFEKYIMPKDPINIPPLPTLAYNPVIDNITAENRDSSFTGTWLLDTGATISIISIAQATALGLTDSNGTALISPDFMVPIGGIGGQALIPGFQIDNLIIPTLNGYNLIFNNARIGVRDIGIVDEDTGEFVILDGVFGSNFFCATMNLTTWDLSDTAFDTIIIDTRRGLLGFDVNDAYPLPAGGEPAPSWPFGDLNRDYFIDLQDLQILAEEWLNDCNWLNWNCRGGDLNSDGTINLADFAMLAQHRFESTEP